MLRLPGRHQRPCGTVSRRTFLTAGALTAGGLTLADLLRAESAAGIRNSTKAVINVHLDGGPPHMDLIDPKPDAPVEIRGQFQPISTSLPGVQLSELLPGLASIAERFVFIRSLVGAAGAHNAFQCQSGFAEKDLQSLGGRPALGCVVARLQGSTTDVAPPFVDLMQGRPLVRNSARPGFLGPAYKPFRPDISHLFTRQLEAGMVNELKARGDNHTIQLKLAEGLDERRLRERTTLLARLDRFRRQSDASGMMSALDAFQQQAVGILTSGRFARALDLSDEDPRIIDRYTAHAPVDEPLGTSDGPTATLKFLLCRRLVEAGVRAVSVSISDFDTHSNNFPRMRRLAPIVDHGLYALVTDLAQRGMLDDVAIVVWGEFGRTPTIDAKTGGRHHWPQVGMCLLAGGALRSGQVLGATDRYAATAVSRPVHYQDVFATLYRHLGIDPEQTTLEDPSGRPQHLLDRGQVIREIV